MGKKGKSKEEKLTCILNIYHTKLQPFNLKEIEKEGSALGVVQQSIKDVNKELCDDGLVSTDKIGSGVFFWSFPSATLHARKKEDEALEGRIMKRKAAIVQIETNVEEAKKSRNGTGREEKIRRLNELCEKEKTLSAALETNKLNDPEQVESVRRQAKENLDHANRWVDNTYAVLSFLTKKKGLTSKEAGRYLSIKDDFDYLEDPSLRA